MPDLNAEIKKLYADPEEMDRLRAFAYVLQIPVADFEDRLQEALRRLVAGRRRWNPARADFVRFIGKAMQSINGDESLKVRQERRYREHVLETAGESEPAPISSRALRKGKVESRKLAPGVEKLVAKGFDRAELRKLADSYSETRKRGAQANLPTIRYETMARQLHRAAGLPLARARTSPDRSGGGEPAPSARYARSLLKSTDPCNLL